MSTAFISFQIQELGISLANDNYYNKYNKEELDMTQSLLDKLLDKMGLKLPDATGHYDPSVYRDEPAADKSIKGPSKPRTARQEKSTGTKQATTELTGVAKYLAKKYPEIQKSPTQTDTTTGAGLTGVAKYLAKKQQEEKGKSEAEAKALNNMTGVERYLTKSKTANNPAPSNTASVEKEASANLTRVEKYLSKQNESAPAPAKPQPEAVTETPKAKVIEKPSVKEEPKTQPKPVTEKKPTLINHADNATQCQAATLKGTQCRRKTKLEIIEKTINKQKYKFAVCSQHNNKDFVPLEELVQND